MDRRSIEKITASITITLLFAASIGIILFAADQFFGWDIFSQDVEMLLGFILVSMAVIIICSALANILLNLSIISINSDIFIEKLLKDKKHDE